MNKNENGWLELPPVQNYSSRKEWEAACSKKLLESPASLQLLLTSYEQHTLVMRAYAVQALHSGKSYREISKEVWLSPQTISGIRKALNEKGYRSYADRSKKERQKKVYSSDGKHRRTRPAGRRQRTKYGTIHLPD